MDQTGNTNRSDLVGFWSFCQGIKVSACPGLPWHLNRSRVYLDASRLHTSREDCKLQLGGWFGPYGCLLLQKELGSTPPKQPPRETLKTVLRTNTRPQSPPRNQHPTALSDISSPASARRFCSSPTINLPLLLSSNASVHQSRLWALSCIASLGKNSWRVIKHWQRV